MYWQNTARAALILETMAAKRFFKLRNNLHVAVEEEESCKDRLWKVIPLLESIRTRCLELQVEQQTTVDEQMIPFKGEALN